MVNVQLMNGILAYAPRKQASLRTPLRRSHIPYRFAADARQLERELERFKPSVVLTDVATSTDSGADLLKRVRSRALVVLVDASAESQVEHVLELLRAGFHLYLERDEMMGQAKSPTAATQALPSVEELHDPATGRLDARRIAEWLGISLTRLSKFIGRSVQSIHKTPAAPGLQGDLAVLARIATSLTTLFGTRERARIWLNAPNPDLDSATPMSLLAKGKAAIVADLLEDALLGHPS